MPLWEALDLAPTEKFPADSNDDRPIQYGMPLWRDLFSPRQLYCHAISVQVFRELLAEAEKKPGFGEAQKAAFAYLALALDKLRDYNSRMTRWHSNREVIVNTFDRHDFAFKWSYAEMAPLITGIGYDWAIEQTRKCISELIAFLNQAIDTKALKKNSQHDLPLHDENGAKTPRITLSCQSAAQLDHITDHSVDVIVMDPPYYDNVMYAELSDFFMCGLSALPAMCIRSFSNAY